MKLTVNVPPAWVELGVKEKTPLAGSKAMLGESPEAESTIAPPVPVGSVADTTKLSFVPTVALRGLGTAIIGRTLTETTVIVTYVWVDVTPSVTMKPTV